ncbi:hypothetical protein ES703_14354 [subsurface metagenome]
MMKALKQLPRRLMVLLIFSFIWSWMEPPFFVYGGYVLARSRLLAIGVFASYYIVVILLLIIMALEVQKITGISFKLLLKQSIKGMGTKGLGGLKMQPTVQREDKEEVLNDGPTRCDSDCKHGKDDPETGVRWCQLDGRWNVTIEIDDKQYVICKDYEVE